MMHPAEVPADFELLRHRLHPLSGGDADFDPVLEAVGDRPIVLLGEATHGTREFYDARAAITRRLIEEKDLDAVAVEADWPDAYRLNRYVRGHSVDESAREAMGDFTRFPRWMWRNESVLELIEWMRDYNDGKPPELQAGFYGLDLYSLYRSIDAVVKYLRHVDPEAAERAARRYACFELTASDPQRYGYAAGVGARRSCEDAAVQQLEELRRQSAEYLKRDGVVARDEQFFAEQNARLVKNSEEYYRAMFGGRVNTWNLRDRHMADTLDALVNHLGGPAEPARVAVWAHNSHLGDARATEAEQRGELNVGQLVRERWGEQCLLVGFTTHHGTVAAATDWDAPVQHKRMRDAMPGSVEALLHEVKEGDFLLRMDEPELAKQLAQPRMERMIGVIYRPEAERASHYFHCRLSEQFDIVLHYDETRAVEPLDAEAGWEIVELPETYPSGL
ncbi:MAG: erythromycin esterase family protein [Phycisphaeraceae bacterium]